MKIEYQNSAPDHFDEFEILANQISKESHKFIGAVMKYFVTSIKCYRTEGRLDEIEDTLHPLFASITIEMSDKDYHYYHKNISWHLLKVLKDWCDTYSFEFANITASEKSHRPEIIFSVEEKL